jgi:Fe2+ or Zn2+ uptake regulation protein
VSTRRTRLPETAGPRWGVELTRIELLRLREVLKVAGLPLTPSRAALLWGIQRANAPVSLAELTDSFESKGWPRATVTRAVNELVGAGLVRRQSLAGNGVQLLSAAPEPSLPDGTEYYLCEGCSVNECLEDAHIAAGSGSGPKALPKSALTKMVDTLCRRREERERAALLPVRAR